MRCGKHGGPCEMFQHSDAMISMVRRDSGIGAIAIVVDLEEADHLAVSVRGIPKRELLKVIERFTSSLKEDLAREREVMS